MRRIFTVSGGGIRGIIPCCAVAALEAQTGKRAIEVFDFLAGTSTGALLVAALQAGIPAAEILNIYVLRSKEIFSPGQPWSSINWTTTGYRFKSSNIANVLRDEFRYAANWCLNNCPRRILLTAMGANGRPWYFVRDNPKNFGETGSLSLIDCACASASAPTYFSSYYVHPLGGKLIGPCFDGGVGVTANPVHQACIEAFRYDSFVPAETRVYSLGTGFYPTPADAPAPQGLIATIAWTVDTLLATADDEQTKLVDWYYPGMMQHFNWQLPRPIDMADTSAIPELVKLGKAAADQMDWCKILGL